MLFPIMGFCQNYVGPEVEELGVTTSLMRAQSASQNPDSIDLIVTLSFKATNISDKHKIHVKIGNAQDGGQLKNDNLKITLHHPTHPDKKCVHVDDSQSKEVRNIVDDKLLLSYLINRSDISNLNWITISITDQNNNSSQKKYYQIKQ